MLKAYKYRLMPDAKQREQMEQHFGACRLVWNLALEIKSRAYKSCLPTVSRYDMQKQLVELKSEYDWLYDVNSQSIQSVLLNIDRAFQNFFKTFKRGGGYPKFKSKSAYQSFSCPQNVKINDDKINLPKIGLVSYVNSRSFIGDIKTVTISKTLTGKYFASVLVDDKRELPSKKPIIENTVVGIDVGLKHFAILSDGTKIDNPKNMRNNLARLKCLQRRLSRKKKGGKNRDKAKLKVALQHEKVANQRKDFLHKLSSAITKQYDTVCVENLSIKNMVKNRKLALSISDAGWGEFFRQLKYKQEWKGGNYLELPRFQPSTKPCNKCGVSNELLTLADREWTCANCGEIHDRDENAAINIKQYFLTNSGWDTSGESVELSPKGGAKKRKVSN